MSRRETTDLAHRSRGEAAEGYRATFTSPAQVTDLRLLQPDPGAAVSRAVERFAEQRVSRRTSVRQPFDSCYAVGRF